jgi:hypothetical protein
MRGYLVAFALLGLSLLCGCSDSDGVPADDPAQGLGADMRGSIAAPGVIVGKGQTIYWAQAALTGYRVTTLTDLPARIVLAPTSSECRFQKPAAGELIGNVHIGHSHIGLKYMAAPIFAFSRKELAERTKQFIEAYKQSGDETALPSDAEGDRLRAVDVVVTETEKPVYLVLQNEGSSVLWNIHAAPDVKIAHVAVISSGTAGIANLDPAVQVEFMNQPVLEHCKVVPVRKPANDWQFVQNAKEDPSLADKLKENEDLYSAYSNWFHDNFGVDGEDDVVGIQEASQVLVGPLPASEDQRVAFKPLAGAEVRIAREDFVLAGSEDDYRARHEQMVLEMALKMAGGNLQSLRSGS